MGRADGNVTLWCKGYIEAIIDELKPLGDVLEIGFGRGIAANRIQTYRPNNHIIVESNPEAAEKARQWAKSHTNVSVIEKSWPEALKHLSTFDVIFYNENQAENEFQMSLWLNRGEVTLASRSAQELIGEIEDELSHVKVQFTDAEVDKFCDGEGKLHQEQLSSFFTGMRRRGNITEKQYERVAEKFKLKKEAFEPIAIDFKKSSERMFQFLQDCLTNHMHKESRLSFFVTDTTSKYEDPQYFQHIITNPGVDFQEKLVPIKVQGISTQEPGLVMVVKKI